MLFTSAKAHALFILLAAMLAACANQEDYLSNRDTITLQAGDAVAANVAIQMIDPWPVSVRRKAIEYDGARMARSIGNYRYGNGAALPLSASSGLILPPPASK